MQKFMQTLSKRKGRAAVQLFFRLPKIIMITE